MKVTKPRTIDNENYPFERPKRRIAQTKKANPDEDFKEFLKKATEKLQFSKQSDIIDILPTGQ